MEEILLYFAYLHQGDWQKIYQSIATHETIEDDQLTAFRQLCKPPYVTILSPEYPESLKQIERPPYVIFYEGDYSLLTRPFRMAVIGTRHATAYGRKMTMQLVTQLVSHDAVIISGMAMGIDGEAHRVALEADGKTIAVLGFGLDQIYPFEHAEMKQDIAHKGLLITEYPPGVAPLKEHFPMRNRIIAGLAQSVLVVESRIPSGTLSTVNHALQCGRDVFCIPARADEGSGCNRLIQQGAILVENLQDILDYSPTLV